MKQPYIKSKKNKKSPEKGNDAKFLILFIFLVLAIMLWTYYGISNRKSLPEKLKESKIMLMQMDSSLESEHSELEAEHQQWIKQHQQVADTANDMQHKKLEGQHIEMIQKHAAIMERHKKLLEEQIVIEKRYQNKEMEDLGIKEQNEAVLRDFEEIKTSHEQMKADHEKMKADHEAMLKAHGK